MAQWMAKAEQDLVAARGLLGVEMPWYDVVSFHAQQAAEKALKALLVGQQTEFPRTHDLGELVRLAEPGVPGISRALARAETLNRYAVDTRYPSPAPPVSREEATGHHAVAAEVVAYVRDRLRSYIGGGESGQ